MPLLSSYDTSQFITSLQPLLSELVTAHFRLSPESNLSANAAVANRSLSFELDDVTTDFLYCASPEDGTNPKRVVAGLRALERTWAAVFAFSVLFPWVAEKFNNRRSARKIPLPDALADAVGLLRWAFDKKHETQNIAWPDHLPSPLRPHHDTHLSQRTNQTCIRVVGWILLHELGHFERKHLDISIAAADFHAAEHEADAWAAKVATDGFTSEHARANLCVIPFALGIVAGINHRETSTHPAVAERFRHYYRTYVKRLYDRNDTRYDGALYNTAIFATTTPLLAQLHLCNWDPDGFQPLKDLEEFLTWWETEMEKLDAAPPAIF